MKAELKHLAASEGLSTAAADAVPTSEPQDLSAFACRLGLPDAAGEAAVVQAIHDQSWRLLRFALGLPADATLNDCLAEIIGLRQDRETLAARLNAEIAHVQDRIRAERVKLIKLDALQAARRA